MKIGRKREIRKKKRLNQGDFQFLDFGHAQILTNY